MNPRPLDWRAVRPKLRKIEELAATLETIGPVDAATLRTEATTSLAVERILTLFVELAFAVNSHVSVARLGKTPDTYAESFDFVADAGVLDRKLADAMKPAAGMRNVLVRAYLDVDHDIVAAAIPLALEHNRLYVGQVARWFREGSTE